MRQKELVVPAIWLWVGFSVILIVAGHGAGPVGLILVFAAAREWVFPVIVGWAGGALLVATMVVRRRQADLGVVAGMMLAMSALLFIGVSEVPGFSFVTAIPFSVLLVLWCRALLKAEAHLRAEAAAADGDAARG